MALRSYFATAARCSRAYPLAGRRAFSCRAQTRKASAEYKKAAAVQFVDKYVKDGCVLGLGSGELVNLVIDNVAFRLAAGRLKSVVGIPSCEVVAVSAAFHGLPLSTLEQHPEVDIAIEEVDQFDSAANAAVKGVKSEPQQPQLVNARVLAERAKTFVVLADEACLVERLRGCLPCVVEADIWEDAAESLDDIFLGDAEIWRRPSCGIAPPSGGDDPYMSPEGFNLVDVVFDGNFKLFGEEEPYEKILTEMDTVEGLVTHGLLLGTAKAAVIARKIGGPSVIEYHTEQPCKY